MRSVYSTILLCICLFTANAQPLVFRGYDLNTIGSSSPLELTVVGGNLFFSATTTLGRELWVTDGTAPYLGVMVKNIYPASQSSNPTSLTELNGRLIFAADNDATGIELWASDGTETGTMVVKDIVPGTLASTPGDLCKFNGKIYFNADTFLKAREMWCTDGNSSGTNFFKEVNKIPYNTSAVTNMFVSGSKLYFSASNDTLGQELWCTDGTDAGTYLVKDISVGSNGSSPRFLTSLNGKVYFIVTVVGLPPKQYLYVTDGTSAGTTAVTTAYNVRDSFMIVFNNELYFNGAELPYPLAKGFELYKTDGTTTTLVKELTTGPISTLLSSPIVYKNRLYMVAETPTEGREIWSTDGTAAGTQILKDIIPGSIGSNPVHLTVYKNHLYFAAEDTVGNYQVFRSDGTTAGTKMFQPANATVVSPVSAANGFTGFREFKDELYYTANYTSTGSELWALRDTSTPISIRTVSTQSDDVVVYPNPNNGTFHIELANLNFSFGNITLYDILGKQVYRQPLDTTANNTTINASTLPKGIYQLKLQTDNDIITKKIIVE